MRFFLLVSMLLNVALAAGLVLQARTIKRLDVELVGQARTVKQYDVELSHVCKLFNDCDWERFIAVEGPRQEAAWSAMVLKRTDDLYLETLRLEKQLMPDWRWQSKAPEHVLAKASEMIGRKHDALGVGRDDKGWFILAGTNAVTYTVWTEWGPTDWSL